MNTQDKELKTNVILQNGDTQAIELYPFNHHWIVYTYLMNEYGGLLAYSRRGYNTYAEGLSAYNQSCSDVHS